MRAQLIRLAMVFALVTILGYFAYQLLPPSDEGRAAATRLAKVDTFSFGGVGYAGSIPEREKWFFTILSSRHSTRLFRDLFEQGTTEAKLYALAGLHMTDKWSFNDCAARFASTYAQVQVQSGCIGSGQTAAQAVAVIKGGNIERYMKEREQFARKH